MDHYYVPPGISYSGGKKLHYWKRVCQQLSRVVTVIVKWDSSLFNRNGSPYISDIKSLCVPNNAVSFTAFSVQCNAGSLSQYV